MTDATDRAEDQAKAQYESICEMVAALDADYERLNELRDEIKALDDERDAIANDKHEWIMANPGRFIDANDARNNWALAFPDENDRLAEIEEERAALIKELDEIETEIGPCESREEAEQRIQEDALEVQVRSGWHEPGDSEAEPEELYILLCTGGPAVRIRGELNSGEPDRAWIEYQDWLEPWKRFFGTEQAVLLAYCREFFFGR